MTLKQKKFVSGYIKNNGNGVKAALEAYDTDYQGAKNLAHQNLQKPAVKEALEEGLKRAGITMDFLHEKAMDSISSGMGVKATQKDANQMLMFMYKLYNAIPSNKQSIVKLSMKGNLSNEDVSKVVGTLSTLSNKSNELIEDIS